MASSRVKCRGLLCCASDWKGMSGGIKLNHRMLRWTLLCWEWKGMSSGIKRNRKRVPSRVKCRDLLCCGWKGMSGGINHGQWVSSGIKRRAC